MKRAGTGIVGSLGHLGNQSIFKIGFIVWWWMEVVKASLVMVGCESNLVGSPASGLDLRLLHVNIVVVRGVAVCKHALANLIYGRFEMSCLLPNDFRLLMDPSGW